MPNSWTTSTMLHLALEPGPRRSGLEGALRAAIREGRLTAGTRLPSTRALAHDLGLARGTVVEAFAQLQAEGYLDSRRGAGTWVAAVAAPTATAAPARATERPARFSLHPGLPDLTEFPHAAWASALRRGLREAPAASLGYGDPRGRPRAARGARRLPRAGTRGGRRPRADRRHRGVQSRPRAARACAARAGRDADRDGGSVPDGAPRDRDRRRTPTSRRSRSTAAVRAPSGSPPRAPARRCSRRRTSSRSAPSCIRSAARRRSRGRARPAAW